MDFFEFGRDVVFFGRKLVVGNIKKKKRLYFVVFLGRGMDLFFIFLFIGFKVMELLIVRWEAFLEFSYFDFF